MKNRTLFNAVEAEMKNARVALSNADRYLDVLKEAMDSMVRITDVEAPLSVKTYDRNGSVVYGRAIKCTNKDLEKHMEQSK